MRKEIALMIGILLLAFAGTALAGGVVNSAADESSLIDLLKPVIDAFRGGQYVFAGALALVLAVAAVRKYGATKIPWFVSDAGGATLTLVGAFGASMAATLADGSSPSLNMAWSALGIAVSAAGGYALIKKLAVDPLMKSAWYKERCPAWLRAILDAALWIFAKPSDGEKVIAKAEQAGEKAVEAKPSTGADGVIGKPEDL